MGKAGFIISFKMNSLLDKLSQLPQSAKQKMSSPEFMSAFAELDAKFSGLKSAITFMEYAFVSVKRRDFPLYLHNKLGLDAFQVGEVLRTFDSLMAQLPEVGGAFAKGNEADPTLKPASRPEPIRSAKSLPAGEKVTVKADPMSIPSFQSKSEFRETPFAPDDDAEITALKRQAAANSGNGYDYSGLSDIIIKESGNEGLDEVLRNRLAGIISLRLRGVRGDIETIDALTKSRKIGGLEIAADKAQALASLIKQKEVGQGFGRQDAPASRINFPKSKSAQKLPSEAKQAEPENLWNKARQAKENQPEPKPAAKADDILSRLGVGEEVALDVKGKLGDLKARTEKIEAPDMSIGDEDGLPVLRMPEELMVPPHVVDIGQSRKRYSDDSQAMAAEPVAVKSKEQLPPAQPAPYSATKSIPQRMYEVQNAKRPIVDGVRLARKLTGPIEELGDMTLIEFRRLADNPKAAADEIREKVKLLEQESYSRKMQGVDAWFKNEVCKFYRLLGSAAMEQSRNVEDVIKERLLAGKPTLTIEEFDAVMRLNKDLRY